MAKEITNQNLSEKIDALEKSVRQAAESVGALSKTIDNLAATTARGFEGTASKAELSEFRSEVTVRLDRIENLLIRDHNNRIERLEDKMRQLENTLGR